MTYLRVIPRDLFNESSLLKCYGKLYLELENQSGTPLGALSWRGDDAQPFDVQQSEADGSIYVANIRLEVGRREFLLTRPLNSRDPWPLWAESEDNDDFEPVAVFNDGGSLSAEFLDLIGGHANA